jgi:hypothetical protein
VTAKSRPLRELCERVGISRAQLDAALDAGALHPSLVTATEGGYRKVLDLDEAERQLRAYLDGPSATLGYDLDEARARREHFAALREELKYRQESGQTVERGDVERAIGNAVSTLRERFLQLPAALASDLAATSDAHETEAIVDRGVRAALAEFSVRVGDEVLERGDHDA